MKLLSLYSSPFHVRCGKDGKRARLLPYVQSVELTNVKIVARQSRFGLSTRIRECNQDLRNSFIGNWQEGVAALEVQPTRGCTVCTYNMRCCFFLQETITRWAFAVLPPRILRTLRAVRKRCSSAA